MNKIIISSDSTCAIYGKEREELGLFVLPLNVIINGDEYHDGVTINQSKLSEMMRNKAKISTSTPTPYEVESFFDDIFAKTNCETIIHFTISSKLSSINPMFTSICQEKYGKKVIIFDSLSVCSFMGNQVKYAIKLAKEGKKANEIVALVKERVGIERVYFVPESLEFLKRGGRITPAVAAIGGLLGIKPVLKLTVNGIEKEGTTRTCEKAYRTALHLFSLMDLEDYELHIIEFDSSELCKKIEAEAKEILGDINILVSPMSINVCGHTGPGTVGFGVTLKV